jgi:hypothetical protein
VNRRQAILSLAAVAAGRVHVPALAQSGHSETVVQEPDVREGDRWTYWVVDYWTNMLQYVLQIEVTHVAGDAIVGLIRTGETAPTDAAWTSSWNATVDERGDVFTPHEALLRFPMSVGLTYSTAWNADFHKGMVTSSYSARHQRTVTVKGWENVVVPAGEFRALRIEAEGPYDRSDQAAFSGTATDIFWYAPEVNRWVKRTYVNYAVGRRWRQDGYELLRYEPAPRSNPK